MVELEAITLFEILAALVAAIVGPIFIYFWRQNTALTKMQAELIANDKLLNQKLDNLISKYEEEIKRSDQQHNRMETKIDDLCDRTARLEARD